VSIIDETKDFITLYRYSAGKSEIPAVYHFWCALSVIGACVQDRVWFNKFRSNYLNPNLYLILEGGSGDGKGIAIAHAGHVIGELKSELNWFDGSITPPQLLQWLRKRRTIYLVTPELAQNFDFPSMAQRFIRLVTELYSKKESHTEGTIVHGFVEIKHQVINWLGGSTKDWLVDSIPAHTIQSGFFGRTLLIHGERSKSRILDPIYPPDNEYKEVMQYLREQCEIYTTINGEFKLSDKAEQVRRHWYENRDEPDDPILLPTRNREDDMMLKVAMLLSLADTERLNASPSSLMIDQTHMHRAQQVVSEAQDAIKILADTVEMRELPPAAKSFHKYSEMIRRNKTITKTALSQRASKFADGRAREQYLVELIKLNLVRTVTTKSGAVIVEWRDQRRKIPKPEDEVVKDE